MPQSVPLARVLCQRNDVLTRLCCGDDDTDLIVTPSREFGQICFENRSWNILGNIGDGHFLHLNNDVSERFLNIAEGID